MSSKETKTHVLNIPPSNHPGRPPVELHAGRRFPSVQIDPREKAIAEVRRPSPSELSSPLHRRPNRRQHRTSLKQVQVVCPPAAVLRRPVLCPDHDAGAHEPRFGNGPSEGDNAAFRRRRAPDTSVDPDPPPHLPTHIHLQSP